MSRQLPGWASKQNGPKRGPSTSLYIPAKRSAVVEILSSDDEAGGGDNSSSNNQEPVAGAIPAHARAELGMEQHTAPTAATEEIDLTSDSEEPLAAAGAAAAAVGGPAGGSEGGMAAGGQQPLVAATPHRQYTPEQLEAVRQATMVAHQMATQMNRERPGSVTRGGASWLARNALAQNARAARASASAAAAAAARGGAHHPAHPGEGGAAPRRALPSYLRAAAAGGGAAYAGGGGARVRLGSVTFSLLNNSEFIVDVQLPVPKKVLEYVKACPGAHFDQELRKWRLPLASYPGLFAACGTLRAAGLGVHGVPRAVLAAATLAAREGESGDGDGGPSEEEWAPTAALLPPKLARALAPFQRGGVAFVRRKGGRALVADEMGLGKTIQGVAAAASYRVEWPVLVICPSSARYHWRHEFLMWMGEDELKPENVHVFLSSKKSGQDTDKVKNARIFIISYDLCSRMAKELEDFNCQVVIADECHYLKSPTAKRTQAILPLLQLAKRAILLSGTPALSRPVELFTQLHALQPEAWASLQEYGLRYCDGKKGRFGWDFSGASRVDELYTLLRSSVMIRRLKADLLRGLPPKRRALVRVPVADAALRADLLGGLAELAAQDKAVGAQARAALRALRDRMGEGWRPPARAPPPPLNPATGAPWTARELAQRRRAIMMHMFQQTGRAKIPGVVKHLQEIFDDVFSGKVLIFGHHMDILNAIEQDILRAKGIGYIRLDGKTNPKLRHKFVTEFQTDPACRVALVGIMAGGVAITLTAARRVVFAELYWTPAALLQAEDRCHRIGQTSEVLVQYLVAEGSLDDCLWPLVRQKMRLLGDMIEGDKERDLVVDAEDGEGGGGAAAPRGAAAAPAAFAPARADGGEETLEQIASELAREEEKELLTQVPLGGAVESAGIGHQAGMRRMESTSSLAETELEPEEVEEEEQQDGFGNGGSHQQGLSPSAAAEEGGSDMQNHQYVFELEEDYEEGGMGRFGDQENEEESVPTTAEEEMAQQGGGSCSDGLTSSIT